MSDDGKGGRLRRREMRNPQTQLWPVGRALTVAGAAAVGGLAVVTLAALAILGFPHVAHTKAL